MSEEPNQVITKKNEGRVAAGKTLAEWNRRIKTYLKKNMDKGTSQESQVPAAGTSKSMGSGIYIGGSLLAIACIGGAYYFIRKIPAVTQQPAAAVQQKPTTNHDIDIFHMR